MRVVVTGGLVACALGALGCGPAFQTRLPDVAIVPSRMVVLPPMVRELELDASDERTELAEADDAVRDSVDGEIHRQANLRGAHVFAPTDFDGQDPSVRLLYARFWRWTAAASMEIAAQKTGHRDFGLRSVGDWHFGGKLGPLADALRADTALAVVVHDTHETAGRAILNGMAHSYTFWKQIGVACLVSLHDGRMIWCDVRVDAWGDLKNPAVAGAAIRELLASLDAPPPPAAGAK
jgi:hypothetical protein